MCHVLGGRLDHRSLSPSILVTLALRFTGKNNIFIPAEYLQSNCLTNHSPFLVEIFHLMSLVLYYATLCTSELVSFLFYCLCILSHHCVYQTSELEQTAYLNKSYVNSLL